MSSCKKTLLVIPRWRVCCNSNYSKADYSYMFPLGIPYLSGALKKNGNQVNVLNLNHCVGNDVEILNSVLDSEVYRIVAVGANSMYFAVLERIVRAAKDHSSRPVTILGGIIVTTEPDIIMDAIRPDYGLMGDGEITLPKLVDRIINNTNIDIPGLLSWVDGIMVKSSLRCNVENDLDSLPFPDFDICGYQEWLDNVPSNNPFFNLIGYLDYPRVYPIMGSRGCPYNCSFCFHTRKYQERSLDNIFEELEVAVKKYSINAIILYDDCFLKNRDRIFDFCKRMQELQKKTSQVFTWVAQGMVNVVDDEILQHLKASGCKTLSYGFESYSQAVLKSMHKPITPAQIDAAYKLTRKYNLNVTANFIFGDPVETPETYTNTLEYWRNNCRDQVFLNLIYPYPNSEIYQRCLSKNIITDKLDFIKRTIHSGEMINFTDSMDDCQYKEMAAQINYYMDNYTWNAIPSKFYRSNKRNDRHIAHVMCPCCQKNFIIENIECPPICEFRGKIMMATCKHCGARFNLLGGVSFYAWIRYHIITKYFPESMKSFCRKIRDQIFKGFKLI